MLSDTQLKFIAETSSNIGLLFFGSMVVPIFIGSNLTSENISIGILFSSLFWFFGLFILNKTTYE